MSEVRTTVDEILTKPVEHVEPEVIANDEVPEPAEQVAVPDDSDYEGGEPTAEDPVSPTEDKDEYGNEIAKEAAKPRLYTEEEVNHRIRERLKRGQAAEREALLKKQEEQPVSGEENPEEVLESFVENTIKKLSAKEQQRAQELHNQEIQAQFESKMVQGMGRYKDFQDVVTKVPLSDNMVLATRGMSDPSAFLYAASKTQGKELERISKIPDALAQAVEIGKLEERMRKLRTASNTPKPVATITGDVANKSHVRLNVDDLIRKDAMKKMSRRG